MKGWDNEAVFFLDAIIQQVILVVFRVGQVEIAAQFGDVLELEYPDTTLLFMPWTDTGEELGRRNVVIFDCSAILTILQKFQTWIPSNRVVVDKQVVSTS